MRGRKPRPTHLKILEGNPGKRPLGEEPQPSPDIPECPAHLDDEARAEWDRITPELRNCRLLTIVDRAALAAYCQAWSRWVKAEGIVRTSGEVLKSKTTGAVYQNPYLAIANRAMKQMKEFLTEFGLTPPSRVRLGVRTPTPMSEKARRMFGS
jgi:P27 family predicted phage terminase small subunit